MESCIFVLKSCLKEREGKEEIEVNECRLIIARVLFNFLNVRIHRIAP